MMHAVKSDHMARRQRGFSLIEVLIAILILAIGLLGMAHMQASGMRSTHGAYLRTQATFLASDIIDSMRANATAARGGNYDIVFADDPACGATLESCDLATWVANLAAMLPAGDGQITTSATGGDVTVEVSWTGLQQNENAGAATTKTFTVDTTL